MLPSPSLAPLSLPRGPALVVAHFPEIQAAHRSALKQGTTDPYVVLADLHCPHGLAVLRACFKAEPDAPRVFVAEGAGLLAMLSASSPPFLAGLRRGMAGAPKATEGCMRVMVFADARLSLTPYVYTPAPAPKRRRRPRSPAPRKN